MPQEEVKKKVPPSQQYYDEWPEKPLIMPHGGAPIPPTKLIPRPPLQPAPQSEITMQATPPYSGEIERAAANRQAQDIAARTNAAQQNRWAQSMRQQTSPLQLFSAAPPGTTDPGYAIQGLQGNIAEQQGRMGMAASEAVRPSPPPLPPEAKWAISAPGTDKPPETLSFKHGGTVPRTGMYQLHRGEKVIPSRMAKRFGEARQ